MYARALDYHNHSPRRSDNYPGASYTADRNHLDQHHHVVRSTSTSDVGPIVGGAVGGFFGLLAIVALVWFILKRRRRWDDIFDKEDDEIIATGARRAGRFSLDVDAEPKPYQYGLVGQGAAPSAISPPNSPPARPSVPVGAADILHARSSSLAPLNMPLTASAPLPSATTVSSRPSTAGSAQPLYPAPTAGILQQQQAQALQHQNYGRPSSTATHAHSHSSVSFTSPPVALAQWTGGAPGPGYNGGTAALMGLSMGTGAGAGASAAEDYFNRSGSPTSIQETRRLQVANARPLSPAESESFSLAEIPSSSSAAAAATVEPVVQRDGKGRIVSTGPVEPLVHLDGGRVEDLGPVASLSAVDTPPPSQAPPAYHE
ncbi:hypothetical protein H0H81_011660 [Sphagnurus paluster]|uniref:Uncharacterized protein n=1 Tax=Sphagnurus paluster TaxID=117069 RepID=A0A9P7GHA6_9AGAR|nr:hypothetical protein H0H81_011660 [Sphagnurus paluster]